MELGHGGPFGAVVVGEGWNEVLGTKDPMQTLPLRLRVLVALLLGALTVVGGIVVREPFKRGVEWLETTLDDPTAGAPFSFGPSYYFPNGRDYGWPAFGVPRQQFTVRERAILDRYERYHYVARDFLPERYFHLYLRVTAAFLLDVPYRDWPFPIIDLYVYTAN